MIDLHIHTTCSDGDNTPEEILDMAEELKLEYISFIDHNTCKGYDDLHKIRHKFNGKIIPGCEVECTFMHYKLEVLCYGIDVEKFKKFLDYSFSQEVKNRQKLQEVEAAIKVFDKLGMKYNKDNLFKLDSETFGGQIIITEICRYEENKNMFPEDAWKNARIFFREYQSNSNSIWYSGKSKIYPEISEIIGNVKNCGGFTFLAHPYEYIVDDMEKFLDVLTQNSSIDGIECHHCTTNDDQIRYLENYCRKNNLYISGGSDYHGDRYKPGVNIATGTGNLNIGFDVIKDWVDKIELI
ncbi:MAG: hypothetical protein A2Y24_03680 [Clostridiales bacterium GWE2_32_10]|nr:MAG: hypothetical protein A2Y24_03680 [Clostridiales bacterium GWE2_32_10]HBY20975.1 hypothetical protein [Clostridiales bacterium]